MHRWAFVRVSAGLLEAASELPVLRLSWAAPSSLSRSEHALWHHCTAAAEWGKHIRHCLARCCQVQDCSQTKTRINGSATTRMACRREEKLSKSRIAVKQRHASMVLLPPEWRVGVKRSLANSYTAHVLLSDQPSVQKVLKSVNSIHWWPISAC